MIFFIITAYSSLYNYVLIQKSDTNRLDETVLFLIENNKNYSYMYNKNK